MRKAQSPAELGFTGHDRRRLAKALHQAQEAKVYQRIQAVLLIAQGYSVDEVARIIGGQRRSVYYWMHRYLDHHCVDDLYDVSRTGRPRMAAQITEARILRELSHSDARRTLSPRRFPGLLVLAQKLLSREKNLVVAG